MNKIKNNFLLFLILPIIPLLYYSYTQFFPGNYLIINGDKYFIQIADSPEEQKQGLMNIKQLPTDHGMLFVFPIEYKYSFWMKNTLIPLDMIWIDENLTIVDIQTATPCKADPCKSYLPQKSAKYVLEINGGLSKNNNYKVGDSVNLVINRNF